MKKFLSLVLAFLLMLSIIPINVGIINAKALVDPLSYLEYEYYGEGIMISSCDDSVECVVIPSKIESLPVIAIDYFAFYYCDKMSSVTIPVTVGFIDDFAFQYCYDLEDVYYQGTLTEKESIDIGEYNNNLLNATWHYDVCSSGETHTYDNDCDGTCNVCDYTRVEHSYSSATCTRPKTCTVCGKVSGSKLGHSYSNACDKTCNRCKAIRKVPAHKYSNKCDTSCNVCKATRKITHTYKTIITQATQKANGKVVKKCSVCNKVSNTAVIKKIKSVKLSKTEYVYNGKTKTPTVTVKNSAGKKLNKNTDYTVKYAVGNKNVGKHKVTVTFKGKYSGSKVLYFTVKATNKSKVSLLVGGSAKIGAKSNKKISYTTSNNKVATVNSKGVITGKKAGTAKITVKTNGVSQKITVKVSKPSIKITTTKKSMYIGDSLKLTTSKKPSGAKISWSVDKKKVAKISSSGKLTAVGTGTVTVTAKIKYKGKTYKDTHKITVSVEYPNITVFMSQEFDYKSSYGISIENNGSHKLTVLGKGDVYCNGHSEDITSLFYDYDFCSSITIPSGSDPLFLVCLENKMQFYTIERSCVEVYVKYRGETFIVTCWSDYDSSFVRPYKITWVKK